MSLKSQKEEKEITYRGKNSQFLREMAASAKKNKSFIKTKIRVEFLFKTLGAFVRVYSRVSV